MAFGLIFLSLNATANAGIFSLFAELLGRESIYKKASSPIKNSQTMSVLAAVLNSDPNKAKGGGEIVIIDDMALVPEIGPSGTLADIEGVQPQSDQISLYVVREGDNLSLIAEMFNVSVNTIYWANDIEDGSLIKTGQTLVILPISGVKHTVTKNDTLASIAKQYGGDVEEILLYNHLSEASTLQVGSTIVIPDGEISSPALAKTSTGANRPTSVVGSGYYLKPVNGGIKTQGLHGYNGVDLAAPSGTPIVAAAAGEVLISKSSGWNGGYGSYMVIRHNNGTQTLYAHNSANAVSAGEYVARGQIIGYVGNTGKSTGPHLHFEVRGTINPF